jgi:hypothetical protein
VQEIDLDVRALLGQLHLGLLPDVVEEFLVAEDGLDLVEDLGFQPVGADVCLIAFLGIQVPQRTALIDGVSNTYVPWLHAINRY